ncbi:hypothetical protein COW36_14955 [bacterium (Candidatus Blackallbacteria) CG17_big_fil_post_rev_8_21_14_2_50_48_46]|uniref:Lipid A biosynthesis acyltransferase n=1 Tax=bacterium (Candidatus Blackallbacteria) CG17_big_fil_post_rev_8_21_14_2_50_48_46 TaxID=2014261 RepID=A0A2M7G2I2_9BACT|nr:MAG: hypothetical protein COW64_11595 [bacterium (Candidatus Blackallbacteria) CG18_big_fil_WC_8_21_14_2_50_49_26]PIW16010.1 MAG: hypothetical protein COW36_14955 [bacterium (Candidatus Blackallbacteria) CG17_big_fil_post_rev_8_21_14_2_50_48_46]PIW50422.1 MAG: hypothetical protein COW20_02670 [bacterium (Candidatus Blackallbacteria) CG13_big_fil_rev_8_21_14_2_50_49_14]
MLNLLIGGLSTLACTFSNRQLLWLTHGVAGFLFFIYRLTPHRRYIQTNLITGLNCSQAEADKLAHRHIQNLTFALAEFLRFPLFKQNTSPLDWQTLGFHHFLKAYFKNKGVILVSAHYGCWELIPAFIGQTGQPITTLVQRPSIKAFDTLFTSFRQFANVKTCYNDSLSGLRPIFRALKNHEIVALVIDQHGESETLIGDFMGHRVSIPEGPDFLSRRTGAEIVPVFTFREGFTHKIQFFPSLKAQDFQNSAELMQTLYDQIETMVKQHPQEWLWSYNRWDKYADCPQCSPE